MLYVVLVMCFLGALMGTMVFIGMIRELFIALKSPSWPYEEGTIIISESDESSRYENGRTRYFYNAKIKYQYSINGILYTGSRVSICVMGNGSKSWALSYLQKYPVGKKVKVYYCPRFPGISILQTGFKKNNYVYVSIILSFLLATFFSWATYLHFIALINGKRL